MYHFDTVESDFLREYGIYLASDSLSWRLFMNLLCNMSSASVFYYILSKEAEEKRNTVEGAENIADDLRRLMAGKA